MILKLLLDLLYNLFSLLTTPINIPSLPGQTEEYLNRMFEYMSSGIGILSAYVPLEYLFILAGVSIAVDVGIKLYKFVMWVIRKIPMLNVS